MDKNIFISYAWDSQHKNQKYALSLTNELRLKGYNATCDINEMQKESSSNFPKL